RVTEALRFRVGHNLPVVNQNVTVREACEVNQAGRRAGAVLLVDDAGRLTGIFTDGDLRRLVLKERDGMSRAVREVMTARPRHLLTDSLVRDAVRLVQEYRVDEIPVVDHDGKPVGLIDIQDLVAMKVVRE
ncbi:MAG TPA: CBS domain-containing protein, partial [Phycisphaerales bacterium]|nr:CBS domain-containing protein [Phycisphaerales bacterium]